MRYPSCYTVGRKQFLIIAKNNTTLSAGKQMTNKCVLDVHGSVHHSTIHPEKIPQDVTVYQNFIIPYLYEAQNVQGDTPPNIRSLKLH